MSGVYVPGAFNKKKVTVEIPVVVPLEEALKEPMAPRAPRAPKEVISEIKPVEVKKSAWGGKMNFVECLKTASLETPVKLEPVIVKKSSLPIVYTQKDIKKEEFDTFMQKYDGKLRKLYEKSIYYDKEYFSKLRINDEQGYLSFCKFMFYVV
jgi:adenine-specific DNA methylase